ncbi:Gfo/Idh/MocA family protein [Paenibacillus sp. CAU 1782]
MKQPLRFGLIGLGWRAEAYLRISRHLAQWFEPVGIAVRDIDKYQHFAANLKLPLYSKPQELARKCDFLVAAVSKASMPAVLEQLADIGIPVLAETPPAYDEAGYQKMAEVAAKKPSIQVAEQYPLLPHHAARTALITSGTLGDVRHVQVSAAHGYHGISLIRKWLQVSNERCHITGKCFEYPVVEVPYRGKAAGDGLETERHEVALLSFESGKSAVFDFTRSQYFSPLRQNRVLIRGSHGEIRDNEVTRSIGSGECEIDVIRRVQDGMEGSLGPLALRGLRLGQTSLYQNPFYPASLSDEELAMAEAMLRMGEYASSGKEFYPLSEALVDVRLSLAIDASIREGEAITSSS